MKKFITILLILILCAGAIGAVWYFSNGFGGKTSTFLVRYGGNVYLQASDLGELRSGAEFEVYSVEAYDIRIVPRAGSDIKYTVGAEEYCWADVVGKDLTGSFKIEKTDNGFLLFYPGLGLLLSKYYGMDVEILDKSDQLPGFDLTLSTAKSQLQLSFTFSYRVGSVIIDPGQIIF